MDLSVSVVRVVDRYGRTAGTGFAVADDLVVTCAHVVLDTGGQPGEMIDLAFGDAVLRGVVLAEHWRGLESDDIAIVRIESWPDGLQIVPLASAEGTAGAAYQTWGFPDASTVHGLLGTGVVSGTVPEPNTGLPVLQLERSSSVTTGYSGGPVLDLTTGYVIAMIHSITAEDAYGRQTEIVLATPVEALRAACPRLRLSEVCPYRSLDVFEEEHARFLFGRDVFLDQMLDQLRGQPRFLAVLGPSGSGKSSVVRAGLLPAVAAGRVPALAGFERIVIRPTEPDEVRGALNDLSRGILLVVDQFEELLLLPDEARDRMLTQLHRLLDSGVRVCVLLIARDDFYSRLAAQAPELMRWVERGLINIPARLTVRELTDIVVEPAKAVRLRFEDGLAEEIVQDAIQASGGDGALSTVLPLVEFALTQLWQARSDGVLRWQPYRDNKRVAGALTAWADDAVSGLPPHLLDVARSLFTSLVQLGDERAGLPDSRRKRRIAELDRSPEHRTRLDAVLAVTTARRLLVTADGTVELIHDVLLREWAELKRWLAEDRTFLTWRQRLEPWVEAWQDNPSSTDRLLRGEDLATAQDYLAGRGDDLDDVTRRFIEHSGQVRQDEQRREESVRRTLDEHRRLTVENDLRDQAATIAKLIPVEPARGLVQAVSLVAANRDALPEVLGPVQAVLRLALQWSRELLVLPVSAAVRAVTYAPDARAFATGGDDRLIRLWRPDGTALTDWPGSWDSVNALAFHPKGRGLASGGEDGAVTTWSRDGEQLDTWEGHSPVHGLAYADGVVVHSDEADGLWRDGMRMPWHEDWTITSVTATSWGVVVVGTLDGSVKVVSMQEKDGEPAVSIHSVDAAHDGFVAAVAAQPDGRMVASGGAGGVIRLWSGEFGDQLQATGMPWQAHRDVVTSLVFSPDGDVLVSGSADGSVRLWDVRTRQAAGEPLLGHTDAVTSVAVSPDATRIVSGGADRTIRVWQWRDADPVDADDDHAEHMFGTGRWDPHGLQVRAAVRRHREHIYRLALSPDGQWLATVSDDRTIRVSDVDGVPFGRPITGHEAGLRSVAFSPDGRLLASGSTDGTVRLWRRRGEPVGEPLVVGSPVQAVAFTSGLVVAGSEDGVVTLFDVDSRRKVATLPQGVAVTEVAFGADRLYSVGEDGLMYRWSLDGQPAGPPIACHDGPVRALAVATTGLLATGGDDNIVRVWDADGRPVGEPFIGHEDDVLDVTFSPDGTMVLSAGRDGTVRVWALDGTQLGDPFVGHAPWATSVVVTVDGRYALSVGADGTLRTWRLGDWQHWLSEAYQRLRRHPLLELPANEAVRRLCEEDRR
jgi:WD40 repeat protein